MRSAGLTRRRNALDGLPLLTVVVLSGSLFVSVLRPPWKDSARAASVERAAAPQPTQVRPAMALQGTEAQHLALEASRQP